MFRTFEKFIFKNATVYLALAVFASHAECSKMQIERVNSRFSLKKNISSN